MKNRLELSEHAAVAWAKASTDIYHDPEIRIEQPHFSNDRGYIALIIRPSAPMPKLEKCKKCGGEMKPGKAISQTWVGTPDFPGDSHAVTVSPGGKGNLIDCMKCENCGWSVTELPATIEEKIREGRI